MADRLSTDTDRMRAASGQVESPAYRIERALADLHSAMERVGQCWGVSDEVATHFATDYVPGRDNVLAGAKAAAELVKGLAERARGSAKLFDAVEQANVNDARS